jgi:hypothetical protein
LKVEIGNLKNQTKQQELNEDLRNELSSKIDNYMQMCDDLKNLQPETETIKK